MLSRHAPISRLSALLCALVLFAGAGCGANSPIRLFGTDLHTVDWTKAISEDPELAKAEMPNFSTISGTFVQTRDEKVKGFAQTRNVTYGDMNGDGRDEAIVPLLQDGPAGIAGILIYQASGRGPALVAAIGGRNLNYEFQGDKLQVLEAVWAGWEGSCCPSSVKETLYTLDNGSLRQLSSKLAGRPEARIPTVIQYYDYINKNQFKQAYAFLTPEARQALPYDQWMASYQQDQLVTMTAKDIPNSMAISALVTVNPAGTRATEQRTVIWDMTWSESAKQWLMSPSAQKPTS